MKIKNNSTNNNIYFMRHLRKFNEVKSDKAKFKLEEIFPQVENLEPIGKGMYGHSYLGSIGNDLVVAKLTKSLPEYWLAKISMVSNPPNVVKFYDAKPFNESNFEYAILHDYVKREALPTKETWNIAVKVMNGIMSESKAKSLLKTKEQ